MLKLTDCIVDILRRCGPGVLPARKLREELLRRRPAIALNPDKLQRVVEGSGDRLRLLEVELDALDHRRGAVPVDSWVVLMSEEDAPDSSILATSLWQSLCALARDVDKTSRVEVCRWAIKAEEAHRLTQTRAAGGSPRGRCPRAATPAPP